MAVGFDQAGLPQLSEDLRRRAGEAGSYRRAIATGELRAKEIAAALARKSPNSRNRWIRRAADAEFTEPAKDNPYDPEMAYRLTAAGGITARSQPSAAVIGRFGR